MTSSWKTYPPRPAAWLERGRRGWTVARVWRVWLRFCDWLNQFLRPYPWERGQAMSRGGE
jgi:hypothetical protein